MSAIGDKLDAGATFVQTQITLDAAGFAAWMAEVRELGFHRAGGIPAEHRDPLLARRRRAPADFGAQVTDEVVERAANGEGAAAAADVLQEVLAIEGVRGIHLIGLGQPVEAMAALADAARATARA